MSLLLRIALTLLFFPFRAVVFLLSLPFQAVMSSLTHTASRRVDRAYRQVGLAADGVRRVQDRRFAHPAVY